MARQHQRRSEHPFVTVEFQLKLIVFVERRDQRDEPPVGK